MIKIIIVQSLVTLLLFSLMKYTRTLSTIEKVNLLKVIVKFVALLSLSATILTCAVLLF